MSGSILDALIAAVVEPLSLLTDSKQRVFWPFFALSLALGLAVFAARGGSLRAGLRTLFSPRIWLHRSALMDLRLLVFKALAHTFLLAPLLVSALAVAVFVIDSLTWIFGAMPPLALSRLWVMAIYTVTLFLAWDVSRYVLHRLMHRIPFLWELHKVHHSAEVLTPLSVYRVHPVESLLFGLRGAITTGLVTGVFFFLFGDRAIQFEIVGVNALGALFNATGANLRHSHVWLSYGRHVERILISPAQHQLHHSREAQDVDCNFGSVLAIWDLLGGTLRGTHHRQRPLIGLHPGELNHDPARAGSALIRPAIAAARTLHRGRAPSTTLKTQRRHGPWNTTHGTESS